MTKDNQSAEMDELILDIAQQASLMPRGKTINADMFPAKAKLLALSESRAIGAKIAELREAWKVKGLTYHPYIKARIERLEKELKERNE